MAEYKLNSVGYIMLAVFAVVFLGAGGMGVMMVRDGFMLGVVFIAVILLVLLFFMSRIVLGVGVGEEGVIIRRLLRSSPVIPSEIRVYSVVNWTTFVLSRLSGKEDGRLFILKGKGLTFFVVGHWVAGYVDFIESAFDEVRETGVAL